MQAWDMAGPSSLGMGCDKIPGRICGPLCAPAGEQFVRWIVFNDDTAEAVVTRLKRGAAEIQHTDPLDAALNCPQASLVLLPSRVAGRLLMARFPANEMEPSVPAPRAAASLPKRPPAGKKSWWCKLVA